MPAQPHAFPVFSPKGKQMTALPPQQVGQRSPLASYGRTVNSTEKGWGRRAEDVKSAAGALSPEETLRHATRSAICPGLRSFFRFHW